MPGAEVKADLWVNEYITPWDIYSHGVEAVLCARRTKYQDMQIVTTGAYGKGLVLDGKWQCCSGDEFIYHEALIHPPCILHRAPRRVLILGGGDGAALREALKWTTVEQAVMVDIDGEVVDACREHLPELHQGSFDDPRAEVIIGDALHYLDNAQSEWDVIISDLTDPVEEGPSFPLFTREYYEKCRRALKPEGFFALQAGPVSPAEVRYHARVHNTVKAVFENTQSICAPTVTYGQPWGFVLASDQSLPARPEPEAVDRLLAETVKGELTMLDGTWLLGLLSTPKLVRRCIAEETRVYTLDDPAKFFGSGMGASASDEKR